MLFRSIRVTVTETQAAAAMRNEAGGWYLIDRKARVLESTTRTPTADVPIVAGAIAPAEVEEGTILPHDGQGKVATLRSLMQFLEEQDLIDRVGGINLNAMYDICFELDGRFAVRIGDGSELERKMRWVDVLVNDRLSPSDIAVLDLTDPTQVSTLLITQEELTELIEGDSSGNTTLVSPAKLMNQPEPDFLDEEDGDGEDVESQGENGGQASE